MNPWVLVGGAFAAILGLAGGLIALSRSLAELVDEPELIDPLYRRHD